MAAGVPPTRSRLAGDQRVPELDGIRAIAILGVLATHALFSFDNAPGALASLPGPVYQILGHGWLGVDLFFVLSGFLISGILLEAKSQRNYFRNFYIRRVLRIMPVYFAAIFVWSFFYANSRSYFLWSSVFAANISLLFHVPEPHGPAVLWSLAVEEHFYLLWPSIVLLLSRRKLLVLSAGIFVGMPILRAIFVARGTGADLIYSLSWFRFDGLAAGAMIAIWMKSSKSSPRNDRTLALSLAGLAILLTLCAARWGINTAGTVAALSLRYTQTYLIFGSLFVLAFSYRGTLWTSPLRWRFMQLTGALSYCIYLIHQSIGDAYVYLARAYGFSPVQHFGATGAVVVRAAVMIGASYGMAWLSMRYFEGPILSLKHRFTQTKESPVAVSASPELISA